MEQEFQRVGLLGRREHPGVNQIVADLLALLDPAASTWFLKIALRRSHTLRSGPCNHEMPSAKQ
jgi:hypothetical protein